MIRVIEAVWPYLRTRMLRRVCSVLVIQAA